MIQSTAFKSAFKYISLFAYSTMLTFAPAPSYAITELNYTDSYKKDVVPYYEKGNPGVFLGKDGVKIAFRTFEVPATLEKAKLVILPGRTEPIRKYAELIYDLKDLGYSIYIMEHRGQGESGRMVPNSQMQYVDSYKDYNTDLETFMSTVVGVPQKTPGRKKMYLLGHSMGGAIASFYVMHHPDVFDAVVMSAPMLQINTLQYSEKVAYGISATACFFGFGKTFALGQKNWESDRLIANPETGKETFSYSRHTIINDIFVNSPETRMGGASYRYLLSSMKATHFLIKHSPEYQTPTLLFQAGNDQVVKPQGEIDFCSRAKDCRIVRFADSEHEIFMERDSIRTAALNATKSFFASH